MEQADTDKLENLQEELEGLKVVWSELDKVWETVVSICERLSAGGADAES